LLLELAHALSACLWLVTLQVADGMLFLHQRPAVHGNLKATNVLVEDDLQRVVLVDFGLLTSRRLCPAPMTAASAASTAPEVMRATEFRLWNLWKARES
jgi:serine/threonine protein kinase